MSTPVDPFVAALARFKQSLSPERQATFAKTTLQDLNLEIARIHASQEKSRTQRSLKRIQPFLEAINKYAGAIDVFSNSTPLMPFVWGPVRFLLQLSASWLPGLDKLLSALENIGKQLPFFYSSNNLLKDKKSKEIITDIYVDMLHILELSMRVFESSLLKQIGLASWPSFEHAVKNLLEKLAIDTKYLDQAYKVEQFDLLLSLQAEHAEQHNQLRKILDNQTLIAFNIVKEALHAPDFTSILEKGARLRRQSPDTGRWLLDLPIFKQWMDASQLQCRQLRLKGIPGSGKSTLCSVMLDDIRQSINTPAAVIGVFCSYDNQSSRTVQAVIRSMIWQLVHEIPHSIDVVLQYCSSNSRTLSKMEDLINCAKAILNMGSRAYLVLDGIDEMDEDERKNLIKVAKMLEQDCQTIKLLFSCRAEMDLDRSLHDVQTITLNATHNASDIKKYVVSPDVVSELQAAISIDKSRLLGFLNDIGVKADGMFLYARLVLDDLKGQTSVYEVQQTLRDLPEGLDAAYGRILQKILLKHPREQRRARRVFKLLLATTRTLREEEVKYLIMLDKDVSYLDQDRRLFKSVLDICGPIIEVENGFVKFVHFTAKEYLLGGKIADDLRLSQERAERFCSRICLRYLSCRIFDKEYYSKNDQLLSFIYGGDYALTAYTCKNWLHHTERSNHYPRQLSTFLQICFGSGNIDKGLEQASELKKLFGIDACPPLMHDALLEINQAFRNQEQTTDYSIRLSPLHGNDLYRCSRQACNSSLSGFKDKASRNNHEKCHAFDNLCPIPACGHILTSESAKQTHMDLMHKSPVSIVNVDPDACDEIATVKVPKRAMIDLFINASNNNNPQVARAIWPQISEKQKFDLMVKAIATCSSDSLLMMVLCEVNVLYANCNSLFLTHLLSKSQIIRCILLVTAFCEACNVKALKVIEILLNHSTFGDIHAKIDLGELQETASYKLDKDKRSQAYYIHPTYYICELADEEAMGLLNDKIMERNFIGAINRGHTSTAVSILYIMSKQKREFKQLIDLWKPNDIYYSILEFCCAMGHQQLVEALFERLVYVYSSETAKTHILGCLQITYMSASSSNYVDSFKRSASRKTTLDRWLNMKYDLLTFNIKGHIEHDTTTNYQKLLAMLLDSLKSRLPFIRLNLHHLVREVWDPTCATMLLEYQDQSEWKLFEYEYRGLTYLEHHVCRVFKMQEFYWTSELSIIRLLAYDVRHKIEADYTKMDIPRIINPILRFLLGSNDISREVKIEGSNLPLTPMVIKILLKSGIRCTLLSSDLLGYTSDYERDQEIEKRLGMSFEDFVRKHTVLSVAAMLN